MTAFLVTVLLYIPLSVGYMLLVSEQRDRRYLGGALIAAWIALAPLTAAMNDWMPFAGGGDDEGYFFLGNTPIKSIDDAFDLTKFSDALAQPGYAWLLSLENVISGPDLLTYKLMNLLFLVLLALTWYRIGFLLESRAFGRFAMIGVLLLTPLWYYVFFLLKDMTIVLLQSLFLLGLMQQWRSNSLRPWLLIGLVTFLLILFRVQLVLQNASIATAALLLRSFMSNDIAGRSFFSLVLGVVVVSMLMLLAMNADFISTMGLAESRVIGSEAMRQEAARMAPEAGPNPVFFLLIYLFSEVSVLNLETWNVLDSAWIRGALALPWIYLVSPFFVWGTLWGLGPYEGAVPNKAMMARLLDMRILHSAWGVVFLFSISSAVISWSVGDSTRWRLSGMPVMLMIAMAGWTFTRARVRQQILMYWVIGLSFLFLAYYVLRFF